MSLRRSPYTARPKSNSAPETRPLRESALVRAIDELSEFEEFKATILPKMRKLMKSKATTSEILEEVRPLLTVMLSNLALTAEDDKLKSTIAIALLDRIDGRPTERKEFTHKLGKLKDEEVDALLLTKLREVNGGHEEAE